MLNKERYKRLCDLDKSIPIFLQYWWLDIVCGENWDVIIDEKKNKIQGVLPYFIKKKLWFQVIELPLLTQYMNPILIYPQNQKYSKKLAFEKNVIQNLYNGLPKVSFIKQTWRCDLTNWLPLHWLNFKQTSRYSYQLNDLSDPDSIFNGFETKIRGDIRKAEKQIEVKITEDYNILYKQVEMTFDRKGIKMPYSKSLIKKVVDSCYVKKQGKIYYAIDKKNIVHAAIFVVWDTNTAYYLLGGGNPEYRNSGSTSLLLWNAIKDQSKNVNQFDFEGSMIEAVERFVRGFGSSQVSLNTVSKIFSKRYYILQSIYDFKKLFL